MTARGPLVLAIVSAVPPSCALPAGRLRVPEASTVDCVAVSHSDDPAREFVIDDAKTVGRLLDFLRTHNDGWYQHLTTYPMSHHTALLKRNGEPLLVVWVGNNWIGGTTWGGDIPYDRLRSLSDRERAELLEILGVSDK